MDCLRVIYNSILIIQSQLELQFKFRGPNISLDHRTTDIHLLYMSYTQLWQQLAFPHYTEARLSKYGTVQVIEKIVLLLYQLPLKTCISPTKHY
jgi:hypothetical protein